VCFKCFVCKSRVFCVYVLRVCVLCVCVCIYVCGLCASFVMRVVCGSSSRHEFVATM
jgi:hypothetical protein